jgi:hypothetical protein
MPGDEAMGILERGRVWCSYTNKTGCNDCVFSDFWRLYQISFDPVTNRVSEKMFRFKPQRALIDRMSRNRTPANARQAQYVKASNPL